MRDFVPSARVIADSICNDHRITTMEVKIHRFMLPEFMTHRAFSRNSASSRAIPAHKNMQRVADEPALPLVWPSEKKGMQGGPPLRTSEATAAREVWLSARDHAVQSVENLIDLGVHKSVANRLLEPFLHHTILITATDWDDFYTQRLRPQNGSEPLAQAEIVVAAEAMWRAQNNSTPEKLAVGHWHLPYISTTELAAMPTQQAVRVCVARCARVSYLTQNGVRDPQQDLALYERLITADPPHFSPLEHAATPATPQETPRGNFSGWHQLRHLLNERSFQ